MIDSRHTASPAVAMLLVFVVSACSGGAASAPPSSVPAGEPSASGPAPTVVDGAVEPSNPPVTLDPATPTGCISLGDVDCERARELAATVLTAEDLPPVYVQVGPFGCAVGERCPTTLAARPEGDVTIEFGAGTGINVHLKVAPDGTFEATRGEAMGVAVEPTSSSPIAAGPLPYTLGHCGVFSGIDIDGSWWDPVGPVSTDSGEAVNATSGTVTFTDPDHGTFVTPGGFSLRLLRHPGAKLLPFCM